MRRAGIAHNGIGGWVDGGERRPDDWSVGSGRRNGRVIETCVGVGMGVGQVPCPALGVERSSEQRAKRNLRFVHEHDKNGDFRSKCEDLFSLRRCSKG